MKEKTGITYKRRKKKLSSKHFWIGNLAEFQNRYVARKNREEFISFSDFFPRKHTFNPFYAVRCFPRAKLLKIPSILGDAHCPSTIFILVLCTQSSIGKRTDQVLCTQPAADLLTVFSARITMTQNVVHTKAIWPSIRILTTMVNSLEWKIPQRQSLLE